MNSQETLNRLWLKCSHLPEIMETNPILAFSFAWIFSISSCSVNPLIWLSVAEAFIEIETVENRAQRPLVSLRHVSVKQFPALYAECVLFWKDVSELESVAILVLSEIVQMGLIFDPILPQKQLVFRLNWSYFFKACFLPIKRGMAILDSPRGSSIFEHNS